MARIILGMLVTVYVSISSSNLIGNITHLTLFYWSHKLLASLKQIEIPNFEGIVEKDETPVGTNHFYGTSNRSPITS